MRDFVVAWTKVMNLDRYDLVAKHVGKKVAAGPKRR